MSKKFKILLMSFCFCSFLVAAVFSMGGKVENIPIKPYSRINIHDGEFLKYVNYEDGGGIGGVFYQVTRIETNKAGNILYRIYQCILSAKDFKKSPGYYKNWPSYYLIDPKLGSVIESLTVYNTNDTKNEVNYSMGFEGMVYWHYKFDYETGHIENVTKYVKDTLTNTKTCSVNVNPDIPAWDPTSLIYFLGRFLDPRSPGIFYMVAPEIMKNPIPFSIKLAKKENISTKAGNFIANKVNTISGDPFIGKLMEPFIKNWIIWVADSDSRLIVKLRPPAGGLSIVLEEISNVNVK